jgi:glutamyl-tRNA synthetase
MSAMRVRFAPSPTGYLHVGGARTALFNWLLARRHGGTFVLRIEDTDVARSSEDMVTGILDGLRWLGLTWDEGPEVGGPHAPYFQSERLERYRVLAHELVRNGHAYFDYRTADETRALREQAEAGTVIPHALEHTSLTLSAEEVGRREAAGAPRAIRFRVPDEGVTSFHDAVHGEVRFENAQIEDFVLLRSDGYPTYHLSVVADDVDMAITDVIRGDDHISNTPKHVLIYNALGAAVPRFAHVPLILGTDKKRLSKRHGATSVTEYERQGFVPEAMVNFLALLGWSPGDDVELLTVEELTARFSLDGISGGNAVFNPEKLEWMNNQYIMRVSDDRLIALVRPWLESAGLWKAEYEGERRAWFCEVLGLLRPRAKRLGDFADGIRPFVTEVTYDEQAVSKHLTAATQPAMRALCEVLTNVEPFDAATLEPIVRAAAEQAGLKAGALIHAVRVALTGRTVSPGLFEVMALLGRDTVLQRMEEAVALAPAAG